MPRNRASSSLLSGAEVIVAVVSKEKAVRVEAVPCARGGGHAEGDGTHCGAEASFLVAPFFALPPLMVLV